ncbi:MAG: hypothetical protein NMK33_03105 [Candidatus Cardinium sp.]|uniref:hypothetical protein n=1 Tax=Cardinium endosymbiont of Dermatophagoides farinae TaxID=2597823 RepID=UPI00118209DC|nr:hypothetical protein [Cardinium endosymbiont of Dermatophagoides farinae]TSJ81456.1 hypothetical protein FPG78_05800 [Cardinium endosymbiont of Dermatophagoides farinae]UWW96435.1 MAG: hypothetical protein NMK33_03105 [Candidatus Cardinium sp.]
MKTSWLFSSNGKGMAISMGLHLFVLALACYIQRIPTLGASSGVAYSIAIQPITAHTATKEQSADHKPQEQMPVARPITTQTDKPLKNQLKGKRLRPRQQHQKKLGKVPQQIRQPEQPSKIDEKGLYNKGKNCTKQTGATLELRGWEWDTVPHPSDTTEELGKIVFEIKVDKNGEIISIQTIEKTVTPMVEKIYADALRVLTFTKTTQTPSSISTGRVTFVIVAK